MSLERWRKPGRRAPRVVIDTNVWVSGLIVPDSASGHVLEAAATGAIEVVASWALAEELVEVLRRPRLRRYGITQQDVRETLGLLAPLLPSLEVDIDIRDPDDAPVVSAALAGAAEAIVTGDADLLDDRALHSWLSERGVDVVAPAELPSRLR